MTLAQVRKIFELYMSPRRHGAIHFFIAEYHDSERASIGGGGRMKRLRCFELPFPGRWKWCAQARFGTVRPCYCLNYLQTSSSNGLKKRNIFLHKRPIQILIENPEARKRRYTSLSCVVLNLGLPALPRYSCLFWPAAGPATVGCASAT